MLLSPEVISRLEAPDVMGLVVGLSGGVDSTVLLDLVVSQVRKPVRAIHVNHQLHAEAKSIAADAASVAGRHGIELDSVDVDVSGAGSMEANAREARYLAFETRLQPGELLLLAHHADDQVETLLFRLFRGSGEPGVTGMPVERPVGRAQLYRPLLGHTRDEILAHARARGLVWREDPTNSDLAPDRNFIRHEVIPLIASRFPGLGRNLLNALARYARFRQILDRHQLAQLADLTISAACLDVSQLALLPAGELRELLVRWIRDRGAQLPTGRVIDEVAARLIDHERVDVVTSKLELREHQGGLHLLKPLPAINTDGFSLCAGERDIGPGILSTRLVEGRGLCLREGYRVAFRQGGEVIRVRHEQTLKQVLQAQGVPRWLRGCLPLVYHRDKLVAVAGIEGWDSPMLVADGWSTGEGEPGQLLTLSLRDRILPA